MRDILEDLSHTLENICSFVNEQLSKSKAIRVIFNRAEGVKINEYREHLNYAMQKFELASIPYEYQRSSLTGCEEERPDFRTNTTSERGGGG
jgi:hypothetical protein